MRDPDLVMQAEQAAMALERAWRRWRRRHGLPSASMLPVSSYVGYSPAEPWGQPRVVFGMAADDAAALTFLLEGHDCVGPVYAAVASHPGAQPGDPAETIPVPRQDVPGVSARRRPDRLRPPRRPDPLDPAEMIDGADRGRADTADELDGPVFRRLTAARAMPAPRLVPAGSRAGEPAQAGTEGAGISEKAQEAGPGHDQAPPPPRADQGQGPAGFKPIGRFPLPGEPAVPPQRATNGSPAAAGASGSADPERPGPLTLAAAVARAAAEARIKAARPEPLAGVSPDHPYSGGSPAPVRSRNSGPGQHEAEIYAQSRGTRSGPEPEFRPPAAATSAPPLSMAGSGTLPPVIRRPDVASRTGTAPSGPLASYLDQGPEAGDFFDEGEGLAASAQDRGNRLTQFGIPGLSRRRRTGAAPGTT